MIEKWSEMIVLHRKLVIFTCLIVLVGLSVGVKNTYFDSATEIWFLKDDPVLVNYDTLKDRFGSNDYLIVGIENSGDKADVLNKDTMKALQKITDFLEEHLRFAFLCDRLRHDDRQHLRNPASALPGCSQ